LLLIGYTDAIQELPFWHACSCECIFSSLSFHFFLDSFNNLTIRDYLLTMLHLSWFFFFPYLSSAFFYQYILNTYILYIYLHCMDLASLSVFLSHYQITVQHRYMWLQRKRALWIIIRFYSDQNPHLMASIWMSDLMSTSINKFN
jgi:hypothetical protein